MRIAYPMSQTKNYWPWVNKYIIWIYFPISLFNDEEIDAIKEYVKKLLSPNSQSSSRLRRIKDTDIGIVSPYKKQCWKLIQKFQRLGYDGITVGTAEVFQGKEKPVMIVSTVRADGASLGFVKEKRVITILFIFAMAYPK